MLDWIIQISNFLLEILLENPWITLYLQWKQMDHRWINWVCIKFAKLILKLSNWFWSQVIVEISFINLWHGMSNVTIEIIFQPKSIQKNICTYFLKAIPPVISQIQINGTSLFANFRTMWRVSIGHHNKRRCSLLFFKVLRYSNLLGVLPESGVPYKVISLVSFTLLHYGALLIQSSLKPDMYSY